MGPLELRKGVALQISAQFIHLTNTFSVCANKQLYQAKWNLVLINVSLIISKAKHFFLLFIG